MTATDTEKPTAAHRLRSIKLGRFEVQTPMLWLGHDLDHQVKVWRRLPHCQGVMVNAYQLLTMPIVHARAVEKGLQALIDFPGPIFVDSGGFLFQRDGQAKIDADQLLTVYKALNPEIAAVLDVPLYPLASEQDNSERWRQTLNNTAEMFQNNDGVELAPVFHAYRLEHTTSRYAQLAEIVPNPTVICVGSLVPLLRASHIGTLFAKQDCTMPPTYQRWHFLSKLVLAIRALYPDTILHVFGAGSLSTMYLLFLLGVDSVDSVAWRLKAGFGEIVLPGRSNRCLKRRPTAKKKRRVLDNEDLELLKQCLCPVCADQETATRVQSLAESFVARATHNAFVLVSEVARIRKAVENGQLVEFIDSRLASCLYRKILTSVVLPELEGVG